MFSRLETYVYLSCSTNPAPLVKKDHCIDDFLVVLKHQIVENLFLLNSIGVLRSWKVVLLKIKRPTDQKEIVG